MNVYQIAAVLYLDRSGRGDLCGRVSPRADHQGIEKVYRLEGGPRGETGDQAVTGRGTERAAHTM